MVPLPPKGDVRVFRGWSAPMPAFELVTPTWPLVLATAALPAAWVAQRLRASMRAAVHWQRSRRGLCASCGYNLRESAGRCPECGHPREELLKPLWLRWVAAVGDRAAMLSRWSVITAAVGLCLRMFDDGSTDFPDAAAAAGCALAAAGIACGAVATAKATGTARAAGVLATLVNFGLLWLALLPQLNR